MFLQFRAVLKNLHLGNSLRQLGLFKAREAFSSNLKEKCAKRFMSAEATSEHEFIKILKDKLVENKSKNVLVYACYAKGSVVINIAGLVACVMLLGVSYNSFLIFDSARFKSRQIDEDGTFSNGILRIIASAQFKYIFCTLVATIGLGCLMSSMFFTIRSVNRLYLLKGTQSIGVITDGLFGKAFTYELPLNDLAFRSKRINRTALLSFKAKNHFFYFLMNNLEGEFKEKELFDHVICRKQA